MATVDPAVLQCQTCGVRVEQIGTHKFHEGTRWGVLGKLGELLINRVHMDMYYCPRCGRVHAFIDGVGDELRGETPAAPTPAAE